MEAGVTTDLYSCVLVTSQYKTKRTELTRNRLAKAARDRGGIDDDLESKPFAVLADVDSVLGAGFDKEEGLLGEYWWPD